MNIAYKSDPDAKNYQRYETKKRSQIPRNPLEDEKHMLEVIQSILNKSDGN